MEPKIPHMARRAIRCSLTNDAFCSSNNYLDMTGFMSDNFGCKLGRIFMSYIGTPCDFCGAMKVSYRYAPNGYVIYECDECGEHWKDE